MPKELNTLYTPAQVSEKIGLSQSSVRRYTIALEKSGYSSIKRHPNNHRKYDIYDIQTLQYFKDLVNEKKLSFDVALEQTVRDIEYIHSKMNTDEIYAPSSSEENTQIKELEKKVDILIDLVHNLNNKTEELKQDNETLTNLIHNKTNSTARLTAPIELKNLENSSDEEEDDDQTNIYEYIENTEERDTEKEEQVEEAVTNNREKEGLLSKIKSFFS